MDKLKAENVKLKDDLARLQKENEVHWILHFEKKNRIMSY